MQAMHRKLRHLADIDALTRLPNRRHFLELATQSLASTEPAGASLLMLDVENLKRINDLLGQATGDEALRRSALRCARPCAPGRHRPPRRRRVRGTAA
jgi:diguanylate cyclase (GGDEF)-like protein